MIVVKIGGSTLGAHDTSLEDIAALQRSGRRVVVVHGGGAAISDWLTKLGAPTQFVRGLRVTDGAALGVVVGVLAGLINKQLVAELQARGAPAVGLSGADGGMLLAEYEDEALGFVGRVIRVNTDPLECLLATGYIPVVAPLALLAGPPEAAGQAQLLNVNADTVAGDLARALGAERLVFLTDVEGVKGQNGQTLSSLDGGKAQMLLDSGVIAGGMIPKVEAGLRAGKGGACSVILDGRQPRQLLAALRDDPPGTVIR